MFINWPNANKSTMSRFEICPVCPTKIYESLQVVGLEGFFWFEVFLLKIDFYSIRTSPVDINAANAGSDGYRNWYIN